MKFHVGDFETANLTCDLKKVGAWRYAEDINTEILCFRFEDQPSGKILNWTPFMGPDHPASRRLMELALDPEVIFVAHNAAFEKAIWRHIMVPVFGFPDIPNTRWYDTLAVAAMKQCPQDLDTLGSVLGVETQKDREGSKLTLSLSKLETRKKSPNFGNALVARTPEMLERVYKYCGTDVGSQREVFDRIGFFQPGERKVWLLDQKINERGIKIDLGYVDACQKIVDEASEPLTEEFFELTGGLKFTQAQEVKKWCHDRKVFIPDLKKETLVEVLGKDIDNEEVEATGDYQLPDDVRRVLEIRQLAGSASVKKLARMKLCVGADSVARGLLQYHGAGPGRWAGRIIQPQNFPRPSMKVDGEMIDPAIVYQALATGDFEYVRAIIGPPIETVVSGLRHALVARPGRAFISGDYAQIEARILLALAGQHDKVQVFITGKPYVDMAISIYGRPIDKHHDLAEYTIGKNTVLGCGFQMGWQKFLARYAKGQSAEFAQRVINTYRNDWAPEVPKLWKALEYAAIETVWSGNPHEAYGVRYAIEGDWLTARIPSGRKLYYRSPRKKMKEMPWSTPDNPDVRRAWSYHAMKMGVWKEIDAYGGHLTENVVQALARDVLVKATIDLEVNGFPIVLTVHDEDLTEIEENRIDQKAVEQIMMERPEWAVGINVPIAVESWVDDRYRK